MTIDPRDLHEGMTVYNRDGHKMGKIVGFEDGWVVIKQGWLLPDTIYASLEDFSQPEGDHVVLHMRGTIPGEYNEGRNSASRGLDVAERMHDERLL